MFLLSLIFAGVQPSTTTTSPRSCPVGQFSCPLPGGCIQAELRCDGIPHCLRGEDENGCHPHGNFTTQSDRCHYRNIKKMMWIKQCISKAGLSNIHNRPTRWSSPTRKMNLQLKKKKKKNYIFFKICTAYIVR